MTEAILDAAIAAFDDEAAKWEIRGWGLRWAIWPVQPGAIGELPVDETGMIHTFGSKEAAVSFKLGLVLTAVIAAANAARPVLGYQMRRLPHGGKPEKWQECNETVYNDIVTTGRTVYINTRAEARRLFGE